MQTRVPTVIEAELCLPAGGTKTVALKTQVEVVVRDIAVRATGPALIKVQVTQAADSGTITLPTLNFQEYLQYELPVTLSARVGESLEDWNRVNAELLRVADDGDDEAFFTLLARDPRHFASDQTVRRILTWQTDVSNYVREYGYKASQFWTGVDDRAAAQRSMEYAKQCLRRLGQCQLNLFDQRGKRPLPPAGHVRGIYYGSLCVIQGLREIYKVCEERKCTPAQCEHTLEVFVRGLMNLQASTPFLIYIVAASHLLVQPEIQNLTGRTGLRWDHLLRGRDLTPSETARALTASAFEVSEDSIERLCTDPAPIPLSYSDTECVFLAGRPDFVLLEFPEVRTLWESLPR